MAEKEERILIDVINPGINCVYRLDNDPKGQSLCKHNGNMEPVTARECRHCEEGMTRQEAIDRMAKEIARQYDPRKPNKEDYEKVWKQELFPATKKYYLKQAECVLNALLEGK